MLQLGQSRPRGPTGNAWSSLWNWSCTKSNERSSSSNKEQNSYRPAKLNQAQPNHFIKSKEPLALDSRLRSARSRLCTLRNHSHFPGASFLPQHSRLTRHYCPVALAPQEKLHGLPPLRPFLPSSTPDPRGAAILLHHCACAVGEARKERGGRAPWRRIGLFLWCLRMSGAAWFSYLLSLTPEIIRDSDSEYALPTWPKACCILQYPFPNTAQSADFVCVFLI